LKFFPHILGIVAAFTGGGLLLAYPLVGESSRGWVLYFAVCALGVTIAVQGLLTASALDVVVKHLQRLHGPKSGVRNQESGVREESSSDP
jgi:hypothetical protein